MVHCFDQERVSALDGSEQGVWGPGGQGAGGGQAQHRQYHRQAPRR